MHYRLRNASRSFDRIPMVQAVTRNWKSKPVRVSIWQVDDILSGTSETGCGGCGSCGGCGYRRTPPVPKKPGLN